MKTHVRIFTLLFAAILLLGSAAAPALACDPPPPATGCGTPGYWKNHPEAWPVDEITIGGITYPRWEAIWLMGWDGGDKTITMFRALVAAKLNVMAGNEGSCVTGTIQAADDWLRCNGPAGWNLVQGQSCAWRTGECLYLRLDAYNNGELCCPARD